jgi:subtilisin-like proprotein convertase family protein
MGGRRFGFLGLCVAVCAAIVTAPAGAATFSNPTAVRNIGDILFPYPSPVAVSGMQGTVVKATATLNAISYENLDELEVLLVAPGGQKAILMNSTCSGLDTTGSRVTFTFDDAAPSALPTAPPCAGGTYRPSDNDVGFYSFIYPAPPPPYPATLSALIGAQPDGIWQLFGNDSAIGNGGSIEGGWSLDLTTTGAPAVKTRKCKKHKKRSASAAKKRCKKKRR